MHRLLLVEDNDMNRDMLSRRLSRKGYTVDCAVDGQAGIDQALSTRPDVIILDMDGCTRAERCQFRLGGSDYCADGTCHGR